MKGYILDESEINAVKIIVAVLHQEEVSFDLTANKIWELFDILRIEWSMETPEEDEDQEASISDIIPIPLFVIMMEEYVTKRNMKAVKIMILERLLELEAYEEIVELGLDKIKLNN